MSSTTPTTAAEPGAAADTAPVAPNGSAPTQPTLEGIAASVDQLLHAHSTLHDKVNGIANFLVNRVKALPAEVEAAPSKLKALSSKVATGVESAAKSVKTNWLVLLVGVIAVVAVVQLNVDLITKLVEKL